MANFWLSFMEIVDSVPPLPLNVHPQLERLSNVLANDVTVDVSIR